MEDEKRISIFNQGYMLQKHDPDLLKSLLSNMDRRSNYLNALKDGSLQFKMEQSKEMQKGLENGMSMEDASREFDKSKDQEDRNQSMDMGD